MDTWRNGNASDCLSEVEGSIPFVSAKALTILSNKASIVSAWEGKPIKPNNMLRWCKCGMARLTENQEDRVRLPGEAPITHNEITLTGCGFKNISICAFSLNGRAFPLHGKGWGFESLKAHHSHSSHKDSISYRSQRGRR